MASWPIKVVLSIWRARRSRQRSPYGELADQGNARHMVSWPIKAALAVWRDDRSRPCSPYGEMTDQGHARHMAIWSIKAELAVWRAGQVGSNFGLPRVTVDGWNVGKPFSCFVKESRAMKGVQNSYTFCFLLVFVVLILVHPALSIYFNILSSTESLTISGNRTLVSPGDVFELGFFRTTSSSRWYLGIWYKKVYFRTYVWVANRDNPLSRSIGTLRISNMNLVLLDHSNKSVWSTNLTRGNERSPVVAELLANGNFVMRDSNNNDASGFLWQSFDFPTDTLLPEMKLGYDLKTGLNRFLTAWRNSDDPSSGDYSYKLENRELPEFYLLKSGFQVHRSGPWNGVRFSGIPENQKLSYMVYNFTENSEEVAYTFRMTNNSFYSRLKVSSDGYLQRLTLIPISIAWNLFWSSPVDIRCDMFRVCGPYAYCDGNTSPLCNCIQGFDPWNLQQWDIGEPAGGCVRRTLLSCSDDGFTKMKKMKLPDTRLAIVDRSIGLKECEKRCLSDCNCTAFANADIRNGGTGCVIWTGHLQDIRTYYDEGQDLYVRLAADDLG
ncbi:hypothetical protein IGI04_028297 [Brassica rapa subsp. trilocularis]|uniref:S-locus glycoprotein n=1 Tax=Brassica rapa subsp. trilocularis TaxID=1813537 RepID=A0ABQ7L474_BRACM|nr:hypothetical protein IGI04_028297 [Brassica rapa subsp. trilocularis]